MELYVTTFYSQRLMYHKAALLHSLVGDQTQHLTFSILLSVLLLGLEKMLLMVPLIPAPTFTPILCLTHPLKPV